MAFAPANACLSIQRIGRISLLTIAEEPPRQQMEVDTKQSDRAQSSKQQQQVQQPSSHYGYEMNVLHQTLERYVDEIKPDPVVRRQIQSWKLQWQSHLDNRDDSKDVLPLRCKSWSQWNSVHSHVNDPNSSRSSLFILSGSLIWRGTYVTLHIESYCCWFDHLQSRHDDAATSKEKKPEIGSTMDHGAGCLFMTCGIVKATLNDDNNSNINDYNSNEQSPQSTKLLKTTHQLMLDRFKKDECISQLLALSSSRERNGKRHHHHHGKLKQDDENDQASTDANEDDDNDDDDSLWELCRADIQWNPSHSNPLSSLSSSSLSSSLPYTSTLDERVVHNPTALEAIRRAVFSTAESTLDVLEVLLQLPCILPCTTHQQKQLQQQQQQHQQQQEGFEFKQDDNPNSKDKMTTTTTSHSFRVTPLADRAKLRLLEDAMFDACERQDDNDEDYNPNDKNDHNAAAAAADQQQQQQQRIQELDISDSTLSQHQHQQQQKPQHQPKKRKR